MPVPAKRLSAVIAPLEGAPARLLDRTLKACGFWRRLAALGPPERLRVLIKPDLLSCAETTPLATSPALVEALIDLLIDRGCGEVAVASAADASGDWLENREPAVAAELLGYRYVTPKGRSYEVLDLAEDAEAGAFPAGSAMEGEALSRTWREADVRIVFAKNRADPQEGYALTLASLADVLPERDKLGRYHSRTSAGAVIADLLDIAPVHLALIDAGVSAHGASASPLQTDTLIAALDPRLADLTGALKMGLDPWSSPLFKEVCRRLGAPRSYAIDGDLAPYDGWRNAPPVLVESVRARSRSPAIERTVQPWLQPVDGGLFPFREVVDAKANSVAAPLAAMADDNPAALAALVGVNQLLAWGAATIFGGQVLWDKDAIRRSEAPVNIAVEALSEADFARAATDADDWLPLLAGAPLRDEAVAHRRVGEVVLFRVEREVAFPFSAYVRAFEVSRAIQLMNDYIGGRTLVMTRDDEGRPLRQVERNLYLPQPNYLALWGGPVIDVTKLEVMRYEPDAHRIWWKTVLSENGSASADDGLVEVVAAKGGEATRVIISGRQQFALPPFAEWLRLDLQPELQATLTAQAYGVFARRTFANFDAVVEGRDPRIGKAWPRPGEDTPRPVEVLSRWIDQAQAGQGPLAPLVRWFERGEAAKAADVDEDGFTHVPGRCASPSSPWPIEEARETPPRTDESKVLHG